MKKKFSIFLEVIYPIALYQFITIISSIIIFVFALINMLLSENIEGNIQNILTNFIENMIANTHILLLISNISAIISLLILILINILRKDGILNIRGSQKKPYVDKKIICMIIIFCIINALLMTGIINLPFILPLVNLDHSFQEVDSLLNNKADILNLIFVILLAPMVEEYIFRRMCFAPLRNYTGFINAALISSILFALFHCNIVQGIYAFFLALILSYLYELGNNIFLCIIAHLLANFSTMFLPLGAIFKILNVDFDFGIIIYTLILFIIAVYLFIYIYKYELRLKGGCKNEGA